MANRLAQATSPYLLQHADNPVDWWTWSEEAFEEARRRDVPVLLSVGYSSCHWCHVMAHESFEDRATADEMNAHFVSVKVDREERPDVDAVYMEAVQAATGHGGWPMTVFLTPDAEPFYFGTYFPPEPRHGMPSFRQVLEGVRQAWEERRDEVGEVAGKITRDLAGRELSVGGDEVPGEQELAQALLGLTREYDPQRGGFGGAPKFPPSMVIEFLLRHHARTGAEGALQMAADTCERMARGGIYDQLGGGFARYSVDRDWVVPHFEKMLYDNALLCRVYAHLWRATGSELARRVALETADFMVRELRTPEGGFASALDADSDDGTGRHVEGAYYVWTPEQLREVLGDADADLAARYFGVTEEGTFEEGASVLQLPQRDEVFDAARIDGIRERLLAARDRRPAPGRDDKVVAAWNGLAVAALAETGACFDRPDLVEAAVAAGDLLVRVHLDEQARIARTSKDGQVGANAGVLEDYADVAEGFLALASVTGEGVWLDFMRPARRPRPDPLPGRGVGRPVRHGLGRGAADPPPAGPDGQRHPVRLDRRRGRAAGLCGAHRFRAAPYGRRAGTGRGEGARPAGAAVHRLGAGRRGGRAGRAARGRGGRARRGRPGDGGTAPHRPAGHGARRGRGPGHGGQRRVPAARRPAPRRRRPGRLRLPQLHLRRPDDRPGPPAGGAGRAGVGGGAACGVG